MSNVYPVALSEQRYLIPVARKAGLKVEIAFRSSRGIPIEGGAWITIQAVRKGVFAPPRKGDWYLSGAIPEAYFARNNLTAPCHLLKLVLVRTEVVTRIAMEDLC